jgi:hypothetical protein
MDAMTCPMCGAAVSETMRCCLECGETLPAWADAVRARDRKHSARVIKRTMLGFSGISFLLWEIGAACDRIWGVPSFVDYETLFSAGIFWLACYPVAWLHERSIRIPARGDGLSKMRS